MEASIKKLSILILVFCGKLSAQNLAPFDYMADPLGATMNAAHLISTDAPVPAYKLKPKEWSFGVSVTQVDVDHLSTKTGGQGGGAEYRADGLDGFGGGVAISRGLNKRWLIYSMFNGINLDGKSVGKVPAGSADTHVVEGSNTFLTLSSGFGYQLAPDSEKWSVQLLMGLFVERYDTDLKTTPLTSAGAFTNVSGDGFLFGATVGIQASYRKWDFEIAPYLLLSQTASNPKLKVEVTDDNSNSGFPVGTSVKGEIGESTIPLIGLNLGYVPWGFSVNIAGFVTSAYSKSIYDGLELNKISFSYSWNME